MIQSLSHDQMIIKSISHGHMMIKGWTGYGELPVYHA